MINSKGEEQIKIVIRQILSNVSKYPVELKHAEHLCNEALKLNGDNLKEKCLEIIGNLIFWNPLGSLKIKTALRKFAFSAAVANRSKK